VLVVYAVAVLAATLTYRLVEANVLRLKARTRPAARPAAPGQW
jgi:peptidoglycan/LPS O-acetylase OafA/YrhL